MIKNKVQAAFSLSKSSLHFKNGNGSTMIIYDDQPDYDDHRRASRIRFAAANLPVLLGVWLLATMLLWLGNTCMENRCGGNVMGGQIGGAIQVFVLAVYGLLHYQNRWLERRCNDAGCGGRIAEIMLYAAMVLAVVSFVLPMLALPIVFGGLLQFVFGLALPSNPLPNLMGYPKPDTPALKGFAAISFVVAVLLAAWLVWMQ